ncbi:MAG: hypothetical protein AAF202_03410, partial [Pseudomonadota bacterium]
MKTIGQRLAIFAALALWAVPTLAQSSDPILLPLPLLEASSVNLDTQMISLGGRDQIEQWAQDNFINPASDHEFEQHIRDRIDRVFDVYSRIF